MRRNSVRRAHRKARQTPFDVGNRPILVPSGSPTDGPVAFTPIVSHLWSVRRRCFGSYPRRRCSRGSRRYVETSPSIQSTRQSPLGIGSTCRGRPRGPSVLRTIGYCSTMGMVHLTSVCVVSRRCSDGRFWARGAWLSTPGPRLVLAGTASAACYETSRRCLPALPRARAARAARSAWVIRRSECSKLVGCTPALFAVGRTTSSTSPE